MRTSLKEDIARDLYAEQFGRESKKCNDDVRTQFCIVIQCGVGIE
jgi:hypothetical protein